MALKDIFISTLFNKCPRCHQGKIFETNNAYRLQDSFKMKPSCSECGLNYEREPGFFYGAMYVSYGLMSALFITWFFVDLLWIHMSALYLAVTVALTMLVFFPLVFRWARIIWLNFFFHYDKNYKKKYPGPASIQNKKILSHTRIKNH